MTSKYTFDADGITVGLQLDIQQEGDDHRFMGETRTVNLPIHSMSEHFARGIVLHRSGHDEFDSVLVQMETDENQRLRVLVMHGRPAFKALQEIDSRDMHLAVPLREA